MTDVIRELISNLKEDAEWAYANEWETPITLGDHLEAAAEMIENLCSELETTQALAEARLKRKNMYKERSKRSLFEKERYRLDLKKEQEMRQHADEVATLFMKENEMLKREKDAAWRKDLPKKTGKYIVCTAKGSVYCAKFSTNSNGGSFHTDMNTYITHWMPMPEPLKEGFDD